MRSFLTRLALTSNAMGLVLGSGLALSACTGDGDASGDGQNEDNPPTVTWHQDIAPIASGTCQMCHVDGGIAPFSLETYEQASVMANLLAGVTANKVMPPFDADTTDTCSPPHSYKNDISLSETEIQLFQDWAAAGAPEGDAATAAPLPAPPSGELSSVSASLDMDGVYVAQGSEDDYQCFVFDPAITETVYVTGVQIVPEVNRASWTEEERSNTPAVAHHGLLYTDPAGESAQLASAQAPDGRYPCFGAPAQLLDPTDPGSRLVTDFSLIGGWVPGALPNIYPAGSGIVLEPGTLLVLQLHFHPVDGLQIEDETAIRLQYQSTSPGRTAAWRVLGVANETHGNSDMVVANSEDVAGEPKFFIPAGADDHTETLRFSGSDLGVTGNGEVPIFGSLPHMHLSGSEVSVKINRNSPEAGESAEECLVHVPRYDFNWQRYYEFDASIEDLPVLRSDDELMVTCTYNNSSSNPYVAEEWPSGPIDMYAGESTDTEMCVAVIGYIDPA